MRPVRTLSRNIEGKRDIEQLHIQCHWDILPLQECSLEINAGPHLIKQCKSLNGHSTNAVVLHRKHAELATAWGGAVWPWTYVAAWDLAVCLVYMPSIACEAEEWDQAILEMKASTMDASIHYSGHDRGGPQHLESSGSPRRGRARRPGAGTPLQITGTQPLRLGCHGGVILARYRA